MLCPCIRCEFIPPHITRSITKNGDSEYLKDLALDSLLRSNKIRTLRPLVVPALAKTYRKNKDGGLSRYMFTARNTEDLPGSLIDSEDDPNESRLAKNAEALNVWNQFKIIYDFYDEVFSYDSIDNNGLPLIGTVQFGENYANAFWDGEQMAFGSGDGKLFNSFTTDLTVTAHEVTHGFINYQTKSISYNGENGAINEHLSDVGGVVCQQWHLNQKVTDANWLIGAAVIKKVRGVGVRSMKNPGSAYDDPLLGKDPQPAHMDNIYLGKADAGGVHINSGILNKAFYEFATRLGDYSWNTCKIWFNILKDIDSKTNFKKFVQLQLDNVIELFGEDSKEHEAIKESFQSVGLLDKEEKVMVTVSKEPKKRGRPSKAESAKSDYGDSSIGKRNGKLSGKLNVETLAKRLGLSEKEILDNKEDEGYLGTRDPEGVLWRWREKNDMFYPVTVTPKAAVQQQTQKKVKIEQPKQEITTKATPTVQRPPKQPNQETTTKKSTKEISGKIVDNIYYFPERLGNKTVKLNAKTNKPAYMSVQKEHLDARQIAHLALEFDMNMAEDLSLFGVPIAKELVEEAKIRGVA